MKPQLYHVLFDFSVHKHGGGSSFLELVREELRVRGIYSENPLAADVVFFNSHQSAVSVLKARRQNTNAVFIQRVDGPMSIYNRPNDPRDNIVKSMGQLAADGVIFQSQWSREQSLQLGLSPNLPQQVIPNAPDPKLFSPRKRQLNPAGPVKLIGTNWSPHINKGFASYEWMDEHLDFARFAVTLIGKVPKSYRRISVLPPMNKQDLRDHLDQADIFLMPSRFEACSNALVEALHLGLPVLAYAGSSNVELVTNPAMLYRDEKEIPAKLDYLVAHYDELVGQCRLPSITEVVSRYQTFALSVNRRPMQARWAIIWQEIRYRARRLV